MPDNIFVPQEISDTPFPVGQAVYSQDNSAIGNGISSPKTIQSNPLPATMVAKQLLNQSLNTKTKKILGGYTFAGSGALAIGDFKEDVSGDIKISPDGVVARDKTGQTTFALDGDSGEATFRGNIAIGGSIELDEGDIIISPDGIFAKDGGGNTTFSVDGHTGDAIFAGTVKANGVDVIDKDGGLISLNSFTTTQVTAAALNQNISSGIGSWTDITNGVLVFTLTRDTIVLLQAKIIFYMQNAQAGEYNEAYFMISVDGDSSNNDYTKGAIFTKPTGIANNNTITFEMHRVETLAAGTHTIKIQGNKGTSTGTAYLNIYNYYFSYLTFGT